MMTENYIKIRYKGTVDDKFATQKDKRKAYQIISFSLLGSLILTAGLYAVTLFF